MSGVANKRRLMVIFLLQRYIPIGAVGIDLGEDVCFSEQIDTLVDSRELRKSP